MDKQEAIRLLGGTIGAAAAEVGVSPQAVSGWPDPLPQRIADRVQAALWRKAQRGDGAAGDGPPADPAADRISEAKAA